MWERARKFGQEGTHVPAPPAASEEPSMGAGEAAEPVQLRLEPPASTGRDWPCPGQGRFGEPQHRHRSYARASRSAAAPSDRRLDLAGDLFDLGAARVRLYVLSPGTRVGFRCGLS